jgi:TATA-binding protein-associated factor Taf7
MGEAVVEVPVLFNFFAADQDPVLRRVACVPGSGSCVDQEGYGGMEPVVCGRALETGERDGGEENDEELWEEVPEGEEGWEEDEEGDDDGDDVSGDTMPPAATIEVPAGKVHRTCRYDAGGGVGVW